MQFVFSIEVRNRSLFTPGKGGGFWAKQGEILPIPPVNVASLNDPPYHVFIFQANLSGPPTESFQGF